MAHVTEMCGGFVRETIFDLHDALDLIGDFMGAEFRERLEELIEEVQYEFIKDYQFEHIDEDENELYCSISAINDVIDHIREASEELAGLIREEDLDRFRISETAGRIGMESWKLLSQKLPEKKEDTKE